MSFAFPRARKGAVALAGLITGSVLAFTPVAANAASGSPSGQASTVVASSHHHHHHLSAKQRKHRHYKRQVHKVLHEASAQRGKPYVYGAAGPSSFDCSGLVMFVFQHAINHSLPHNAAAQYSAVRHISRRQLHPGDLVFVDDGGYISHVGIYAGHNRSHRYWWVAPHTGTHVHKQPIYSAHFVYGRIMHKH
jgi:cell wall-associated NlpC family hydrolase